jgi:hypothetical protein
MSYAAASQDDSDDRYYTQVEAGDVRLFTLDQLDAAFNAGLIHENTYVCLEGDSTWLTLAEVAGLGDEEPVSAPMPVAPVVSHYGYATPSAASSGYGVAPMVMPRSIAPVVNDLSFDDDDLAMFAMRPKRSAGKYVVAFVMLALGGLGFAVVQSGGVRLPKLNLGHGFGQASAASLSLSSLKDAQVTPKPVAPTPAPEVAKPEPPKVEETKPVDPLPAVATDADKGSADKASTSSADADKTAKKSDSRLSDDVKAALLSKDTKQASDQKHKKAARTAVVAKHNKPAGKGAKSSTGFKTGGSAYDPLNGKL